MSETHTDRNATIKAIRTALQRRSGKPWSVTGGRGTAWGWIRIKAPPARSTWGWQLRNGQQDYSKSHDENWEAYDTGEKDRCMSPADRAELTQLLGLDQKVSDSGDNIPAGYDYYREYIDRAEGRAPSVKGEPYWD
jgi:hypothetical protein